MTGSLDSPGTKPLVLFNADPRQPTDVFSQTAWAEFNERFEVVEFKDAKGDAGFDNLLPRAFAIVGQPDLPRHRLERAGHLRAICNIEGNFFPNVDYEVCFAKGTYVLGCGPVYAQPVAEYALGLALDLARGITREDRAFRAGRERYTIAGNADAILLRHADVGLIGFGNLGRALLTLLRPFAPHIRVYDPWVPDAALKESDVEAATLEDLLTKSTFVFVLATITDESTQLLNADRLDLLPAGARLILVSRAAVADFPALYERVGAGRFLAAIDVWPDEPVPADDQARRLEGLTLSAHRAGGIPAAFHAIGDLVLDDLRLIESGLPPLRMQVAARELVQRYRNKPVVREASSGRPAP
jgi:phosphoglycerate dehydrogenase-like enzyme